MNFKKNILYDLKSKKCEYLIAIQILSTPFQLSTDMAKTSENLFKVII